jgi:hypothetical protein
MRVLFMSLPTIAKVQNGYIVNTFTGFKTTSQIIDEFNLT